jgi:hypothetical protein
MGSDEASSSEEASEESVDAVVSVDDLEVDLMSFFPASSDDDDGAAVLFKRSAMPPSKREEFLLDTSTSSPSECNAVLMTVNDSSFSFFEVGIASNQIETEMRTWAGGGTPQKNDIDRIFKRFFGGRGARPFFGLFRREKNIFPPRQIPTDSMYVGRVMFRQKKKKDLR